MTDLPDPAGALARPDVRNDFGPAPDFLNMARRLGFMLEAQIGALESDTPDEGFSEPRVKALLLLTKTLQAMEDMVQKQEKARNEQGEGPGDILEFRAELARKLEALGNAGEDPGPPGAS